jgi:hypothetical protein
MKSQSVLCIVCIEDWKGKTKTKRTRNIIRNNKAFLIDKKDLKS